MSEFESQEKVLPPLSQSRYGDLACETLYVCKHVWCERIADSGAAARGTEIHETLATYINHLVNTRRSTDLEAFDGVMPRTSSDARQVLERFCDNHSIDPEKILATELHIALDQHFSPIEDSEDDARTAEYEGTLDLVLLHSLTSVADFQMLYRFWHRLDDQMIDRAVGETVRRLRGARRKGQRRARAAVEEPSLARGAVNTLSSGACDFTDKTRGRGDTG